MAVRSKLADRPVENRNDFLFIFPPARSCCSPWVETFRGNPNSTHCAQLLTVLRIHCFRAAHVSLEGCFELFGINLECVVFSREEPRHLASFVITFLHSHALICI